MFSGTCLDKPIVLDSRPPPFTSYVVPLHLELALKRLLKADILEGVRTPEKREVLFARGLVFLAQNGFSVNVITSTDNEAVHLFGRLEFILPTLMSLSVVPFGFLYQHKKKNRSILLKTNAKPAELDPTFISVYYDLDSQFVEDLKKDVFSNPDLNDLIFPSFFWKSMSELEFATELYLFLTQRVY